MHSQAQRPCGHLESPHLLPPIRRAGPTQDQMAGDAKPSQNKSGPQLCYHLLEEASHIPCLAIHRVTGSRKGFCYSSLAAMCAILFVILPHVYLLCQ